MLPEGGVSKKLETEIDRTACRQAPRNTQSALPATGQSNSRTVGAVEHTVLVIF
jgi:hypothetical protein